MLVLRAHHVAITTSNLARLRAFYVDVLRLRPDGGFPDQNIAFIDVGSTLVELLEEVAVGADRRQTGWDHLALEVPDVTAAYADLSARGIVFDIPPEDFPPGAPKLRIAFFRDPDGNSIELVQPLQKVNT